MQFLRRIIAIGLCIRLFAKRSLYMQLIVDTVKPAGTEYRITQGVRERKLFASPRNPADRIADRRVRPNGVRCHA